MNELENILKVFGLADFKEAPGIERLFGFDKPTRKEEPKPESKTELAEVAGIAALVSLLKAASEKAEKRQKKEPEKTSSKTIIMSPDRPINIVATPRETKSLEDPLRDEDGVPLDREERKLVLRDTLKQNFEELAQSNKQILTALAQTEPDKMDYRKIHDVVKYIDVLISLRSTAARLADVLTYQKDNE